MTSHQTQVGDRWDRLAWQYLGTPASYRELLAANPTAPIVAILPPGLVIQIPESPSRRRRATG